MSRTISEPGRDISRLKNDVLSKFATTAHYLHSATDGRLFFKNTENLIAKLNSTAKGYLREQSVKELKAFLKEVFEPTEKHCYQDLLVLPAVDDIKPAQDRVTLVISSPHIEGLHPDLRNLYEQATYQNRLLFLTGQRNYDNLLESARKYRAIQEIVREMESEKTPTNDPQMLQARELLDKLHGNLLMSVKETFSSLHYPSRNGLTRAEFLMRFNGNQYQGERQIMEALTDAQKYTGEVTGEIFVRKVEMRLFTQKTMPWADIKKRAATNPAWQWHRTDALDLIKADCVKRDVWREENGYLTKGPFPKPETSLTIQELSRNDDTGKVKLRLTPVHADTLYAEIGGLATTASHLLESREFETDALEVSFLAVDASGEHQSGEPLTWRNRITLKSRAQRVGAAMRVELRASPQALIRYTTDGSNPRNGGGLYDGEFEVPEGTLMVQAIASKNGIESEIHQLAINWDEQGRVRVDRNKPAVLKKFRQCGSTPETLAFIS